MCIGNGIPAMVVRWAEQTSKGFMWQDIGLGDWLFDFDQADDRERFPTAALAWARNLDEARRRSATARAIVEDRQRATMDELHAALDFQSQKTPNPKKP
jgi:hypothetical protein